MLQAKRELLQQLGEARAVYENDVQLGAALALDACIHFIDAVEGDLTLAVPLINLVSALGDAKRGKSNAHLALAKNEGSKSTIQDAHLLGCAVAAISLCKDAGDTLPEAAKRVHAIVSSRWTTAFLIEFRKRLSRGAVTVPAEARSNFEYFYRQTSKDPLVARLTPRQRADHAMAVLRSMA